MVKKRAAHSVRGCSVPAVGLPWPGDGVSTKIILSWGMGPLAHSFLARFSIYTRCRPSAQCMRSCRLGLGMRASGAVFVPASEPSTSAPRRVWQPAPAAPAPCRLHSKPDRSRVGRAVSSTVCHAGGTHGSSSTSRRGLGAPLPTTETWAEDSGDEDYIAISANTTADEEGQETDADVLIEFKDVYKAFGDNPILRGASFKIRRGEAVGIIGASGTGKSTTLRIAAGLLAPDKGEVLIMGRPRAGLLSDQVEEEHLRVGMVFQNAALFDSLTVGENVGFLLYEHSNLPEAKIRAMVADSLAKVGLRGVEDLYPAELSGGMKKRVALARAVVSDSRGGTEQVIMYDEPTAGLDPVASTVVEDLMRTLHNPDQAEGDGTRSAITSYIVVTHQHSTIRRAVDRIIFLHKGKVVWEGSVGEFDTTDEPIVRQFAEGSLDGPISYV